MHVTACPHLPNLVTRHSFSYTVVFVATLPLRQSSLMRLVLHSANDAELCTWRMGQNQIKPVLGWSAV